MANISVKLISLAGGRLPCLNEVNEEEDSGRD
jgi:hypothetical protein